MKRFFIIILCLMGLSVFADRRAQIMAQRRPAGGFTDPSGSNTLWAWWVSSDVVVNRSINYTNPWIDRVQGILLQSTTLNDVSTNALLGIYTGNVNAGLTNNPTSQGSNSTVCIIFRPVGIASGLNPPTCLFGPWDLGDATQGATPGGISINKATAQLYWGTAFVGGSAISAALENAKTYDAIGIQAASTLTFFTNGLQSATLTKFPPLTGWPWRYVGQDLSSAANVFNGYVKEVLIWSNSFSTVQTSNVHHYATNTYSYTP